MQDKHLYIIRGISGAGKSTLGYTIAPYNCYSADDYFTTKEGYNFNPEQIQDAHDSCRGCVEHALKMGKTPVAVANTFTERWEFDWYLGLAEQYGYMAHVMTVENYHGGTNTHNVPDRIVEKMEERYELNLAFSRRPPLWDDLKNLDVYDKQEIAQFNRAFAALGESSRQKLARLSKRVAIHPSYGIALEGN